MEVESESETGLEMLSSEDETSMSSEGEENATGGPVAKIVANTIPTANAGAVSKTKVVNKTPPAATLAQLCGRRFVNPEVFGICGRKEHQDDNTDFAQREAGDKMRRQEGGTGLADRQNHRRLHAYQQRGQTGIKHCQWYSP